MSSSKFVTSIIGSSQKKEASNKPYLTKQTDWRFKVARVLLTGIVQNQFYRSEKSVVEEALKLLPQAAKEDPSYLLKGAHFARSVNMKGMVKLSVAALNGHADDDFLAQNRESIVKLLATFHPGQLLQFVELCKSKKTGKGFGSRPQKWIRSVMEDWSESQLEQNTIKYPTATYALLRLVHPRYTGASAELAKYLLNGPEASKPYGKKQQALQVLKTEIKDSLAAAKHIIDHSIPWDAVKGIGFKMTRDLALAEMTQMNLSALLLNLRSLEEHDAFSDEAGITALKMKMGEVKNGRSIPIDFAKPYKVISNSRIREILVDAMDESLNVPIPGLEGKKVGLSVDISSSMREVILTAGLLAVPFLKADDLWFTTFDHALYQEGDHLCPKLIGFDTKSQIKKLLALRVNGSTDIAASIINATRNNRFLDLMVIVTDEHQNLGTHLMDAWREYRNKRNANAELWIINAANSEWTAVDFNDPSVTVYQSLTPQIFKNLQFAGVDLVTAINQYKV